MAKVDNASEEGISKSVLYLMSAGAGLVVANNYYNQPLLNLIAKDFGVSESAVSNIPLFTQLGYAFGLLFIIPLGDKFPRKKMFVRRPETFLRRFLWSLESRVGDRCSARGGLCCLN